MTKYISIALIVIFMGFGLSATSFAGESKELGNQLGVQMVDLITFAELGNIGSKDDDCKSTPFPVTDIENLIQSELAPWVAELNDISNELSARWQSEFLPVFRGVTKQELDGVRVVVKNYQNAKQQAFEIYGFNGGCASLSTLIQSGIYHKQHGIRNLLLLIKEE